MNKILNLFSKICIKIIKKILMIMEVNIVKVIMVIISSKIKTLEIFPRVLNLMKEMNCLLFNLQPLICNIQIKHNKLLKNFM